MRIYKARWFARWAKSEGISEKALLKAVDEIVDGLLGSDLGGGLYKKRVALPGRGKSGGARTLIAYSKGRIIFFIYGFAKNEKENIHIKELQALKLYASELLSYTQKELETAVQIGKLIEVIHHGEE